MMIEFLKRAAIVAILVLSPFNWARAELKPETIVIFASEEWKGATNRDGSGLYWDILRAVFEPEGYRVKPVIRSYTGSVNLVINHSVDGMVGAYHQEIQEGLYPNNHFAVDMVQALFRRDAGIEWAGLNTIKGKRVAWIEGYAFNQYLPPEVVYNTAVRRLDTRKQGLSLIDMSKIDFFLDAEGDLKDFFADNRNFRSQDYIMEPVLELALYVVFAKNEKGRRLVSLFDRNFSALLRSGHIQALYKRYPDSNFTMPSTFSPGR